MGKIVYRFLWCVCLLGCLWLISGSGCWSPADVAGLPCHTATDCLYPSFKCIGNLCQRSPKDGVIGSQEQGQDASTPDKEPPTTENTPQEQPKEQPKEEPTEPKLPDDVSPSCPSGRKIIRLSNPVDTVSQPNHFAFGGTLFALASGKTFHLWDYVRADYIYEIATTDNLLTALAFGPNKQKIYLGDKAGNIQIRGIGLNDGTHKAFLGFVGGMNPSTTTVICQQKSCPQQPKCQYCSTQSGGRCYEFMQRHCGKINQLLVKNNELLSASEDGTVRLWNLTTNKHVRVWNLGSAVLSVAFHPTQQRFFAFGADNILSVWSLNDTKKPLVSKQLDRSIGSRLLPFDDGQSVLVTIGSSIERYSTTNGMQLKSPTLINEPSPKQEIKSIAIDPTQTYVLTGTGKEASVWKLSSDKTNLTLLASAPHIGDVQQVVFGPEKTRLFASNSSIGKIRFWQLPDATPSSTLPKTFQSHGDTPSGLGASPDGRWFVSLGKSDGTYILWDAKELKAKRQDVLDGQVPHIVRFNPQSTHFYIGTTRGLIYRLAVDETAEHNNIRFSQGKDSIEALAVWPNEKKVLVGNRSGQVRDWHFEEDRVLGGDFKLELSVSISGLQIHPKGDRVLVSTTKGKVMLFFPGEKQPRWTFPATSSNQPDGATHIFFLEEGKRILVGWEKEKKLQFLDAETGQPISAAKMTEQDITHMALHPNNRQFVVSGVADEIRKTRYYRLRSQSVEMSELRAYKSPDGQRAFITFLPPTGAVWVFGGDIVIQRCVP